MAIPAPASSRSSASTTNSRAARAPRATGISNSDIEPPSGAGTREREPDGGSVTPRPQIPQ